MPLNFSDDQLLDLLAELRRYWRNEGSAVTDAKLALRIISHRLLSRELTDSDVNDLLD